MSNADRCAREGCGKDRNNSDHWNLTWPGHHAFVKPAPQPAPSGDACHCGHPFTARCKPAAPSGADCEACEEDSSFRCDVCGVEFCGEHATQHKHATSGDEAKVREIAGAAFDEWFGSADGDLKKAFVDVANKALTVGLESGFRVAEDNAEISTHDGWHVTAPAIDWSDARKKLADAIARRGSEGT